MIHTYILVGEQCRSHCHPSRKKEGSCTNNSISPHFLSDKESGVVSVDCAVRSPHKVQGTIFLGCCCCCINKIAGDSAEHGHHSEGAAQHEIGGFPDITNGFCCLSFSLTISPLPPTSPFLLSFNLLLKTTAVPKYHS